MQKSSERNHISVSSYHTANATVSFHDTLCVDVTGVGLTVRAKPGTMAASHLVTCESSSALSTAEGALVRTAQSHKPEPLALKNDYHAAG